MTPVAGLLSSRLSVRLSGESLKKPDFTGFPPVLTTMTTDFYKKRKIRKRGIARQRFQVFRCPLSGLRCQPFLCRAFLQEVSHMEQATAKAKAVQTAEHTPATMVRKIGKTTYKVCIHFSQTSKETMEDKLLRLIKNDIRNGA